MELAGLRRPNLAKLTQDWASSTSTLKCPNNDFTEKSQYSSIDLEAARTLAHLGRPSKLQRLRSTSLYLLISVYQRLFGLVALLNLAWFLYLVILHSDGTDFNARNVATAISANFFVLVLIRLPEAVNALFIIFHIAAKHSPSWIRIRILAQVHQYGGIHSSCAVSATVWYILFLGIMASESHWEIAIDYANISMMIVIAVLLILMVVSAHPRIRHQWHNYFETMHRFAGWTTVVVFWIQTVLVAYITAGTTYPTVVFVEFCVQPSSWFLLATTVIIIYSWTRLRKAPVTQVEHLSNHSIRLYFDHVSDAKSCRAIKLSTSPLMEWHPFACIPEPDKNGGFSVIISRAGDWTKSIIESPSPPSHFWLKEVAQYGVLWNATMFKRPLIIATGSGIGPCLGLFNGYPDLKCRVIWSARHIEQVYGSKIVAAVQSADPDAVIIDTHKDGKPVLEELALRLYKDADADAVFVISNPKGTASVVNSLRAQGIGAYGPIWDS